MYLSEVFDHLTYGELSQTSIGGAEEGGIQPERYPALIAHINLGLTEIYKRFPIKLGSVNVQLYEDITTYPLRLAYAVSNVTGLEPVKFIEDTVEDPFPADVLQVERIVDLDGEVIPVNLLDNANSVFLPEEDVLSISSPDATQIYTVSYKAEPTPINLYVTDPTVVQFTLPSKYMEALLSYVAHRAFTALPTPEPSNSATFYTRYLAACANINNLGLVNKMATENTKFENNGFV